LLNISSQQPTNYKFEGSEPSSTGLGSDVQIQYLSSNPHGSEFRFLFILEVQADPDTHAIYFEERPGSKILPIF
jgi:hypothetical protein